MSLPPKGIVIPKVTIASLAVYGVMGGLGMAVSSLSSQRAWKHVGSGLSIAAIVGAGYAISHAIVANVAPETIKGLDPVGVKEA